MSVKEFVATLVGNLKESAHVSTAYGEPIEVKDRTLIPVAKSVYGFGGRPKPEGDVDPNVPAQTGGAVSTSPLGVLEVTEEGTRFVAVPDNKPGMVIAAFCAGLVLGGILIARGRRRELE